MKRHQKPVRMCHACPLNRGDHCWAYQYPRGQWRGGKTCRMRNAPAVLDAFVQWQKQPSVKSRQQIRQAEHRGGRRVRSGGEGAAWLHERGLL